MAKKTAEGPKRIVTLSQQGKVVEFGAFKLENEIVFSYFNKVPEVERDEALFKAIYIGVLALMEDRLAAFLSATESELGVRLESLKMIFEMKKQIFFKTAVKGMAAEEDVVAFLNEYFPSRGWKDEAIPTGSTAGLIERNKTGDVVCSVDGTGRKIVVEVKFDKGYAIGDIETKDVFARKETAWSQILEAKANRDAEVGIMVFDRSISKDLSREVESVGFIRGVGLVAIVDAQAGDYSNLAIAYALARDIVVNAKVVDVEDDVLSILVKRVLWDLGEMKSFRSNVEKIRNASEAILEDLNKRTLSMQFTMEYLAKFLKNGSLSKEDLFTFYSGEEVKDRFKGLDAKKLTEPPGA